MSFNYGLLQSDYDAALKKLNRQKNYLESQSFISGNGTQKTLLDVSFSANLSKRYYPRILNKVHTFVSYSISRDLVPIFLTVTLDGFFRDLMRGDRTRYDQVSESYAEHIPNNDRNGYYRDYIEDGHSLNPHDLYKILSHQMHRFTRSHALQKIRKRGDDYTMIRVSEPHKKDGVPHFHVLMYVPQKDIVSVYHAFAKFFPAPRNTKKLSLRDGGRVAEEIYPGSGIYETVGFQTVIRSAAGYILKYILKTFRNMIEGKELDYLQAWYIHYKIPRIITTHSLVSQDVYYHASLLDDDWFYLTDIKHFKEFERNKALNSFRFNDDGRELIYNNGHYKIVHKGYTVKEFGTPKHSRMRFSTESFIVTHSSIRVHPLNRGYWRFVPKKRYRYKIDHKDRFIPLELPDHKFMVIDSVTGEIGYKADFSFLSNKTSVPVPGGSPKDTLTDLELFDMFYNFDFDRHNPAKFQQLKKIMVDRGLLEYEDVNINDAVGFEVIRSYDLYTKQPIWTVDYYSDPGD